MSPRGSSIALIAYLLAGNAAAQKHELTREEKTWLEEEVTYIISDREKNAFLELQSEEERRAFIGAFWRKRDPDPLTPINEFREEHYRRIEHANRELGRDSAVPGWMTDRGRMYIILGPPRDRETFLGGVGGMYNAEVWFYDADRERSLPPLYLLFFQEGNAGPYRLFNHLIDGPEDLIPAQPLNAENPRQDAYNLLQNISPDLAHAAITLRADQGALTGIVEPMRSSLEAQQVLAEISQSPFRRLDTSYVDAARDARGLVESEYLFNYVPSAGTASVIPGPAGTRFVHYSIEIEPQHMTLANDAQRYYTRFDLRGEVTSAVGEKTVLQFSKEPYLEVTESQFGEVKARPFAYRDMFPLIPGEFRFRLVLKNKARSEYTLFETEIAVPDESTEAIALMTPVLLRGVGEASGSQPDLHRTYQLGSAVLEPNARRAYAIGEAVLVYVPVENATERHRLSFRVLSVDGTTEVAAKTAAIGDYAQKPIIETLVPRAVVGGHYRLSVALLDPSGQELVARSVDFDLSPLSRLPRPWALRESIDGEKAGLVFTALAEQALRLGEPSRARDYCRKAVAADPNLTTARLLLARFHLDDDQPLEAARLLEPAHVQNKEHIEVLATLGDAYLKLGRYSRAVELLEAALARRRPDARLLNTLAVAHAELGHAERAIEYLKRSLELDPAQEAVAALLARLQSR